MSGLVVSNLTVSHGAIRALRDVSFEVQEGELTAVLALTEQARPHFFALFRV